MHILRQTPQSPETEFLETGQLSKFPWLARRCALFQSGGMPERATRVKAGQLREIPYPLFRVASGGALDLEDVARSRPRPLQCELCAPVDRLTSSGSGGRQSGEAGEVPHWVAIPAKCRCALPPIVDHAVARDSTDLTADTHGEAVQQNAVAREVALQPYATARNLTACRNAS